MRALALLLILGACSGEAPQPKATPAPQDLESAAIERGLIPDPDDSEIVGLYARDTDRVCIVREDGGYRIGAFVDYGDRITCSGSGRAARAGSTLRVELGQDCGFDARIVGEAIRFPGNVPDDCAKLCSGRASWAGLEVERLSESGAEAAALRDPAGRALCN